MKYLRSLKNSIFVLFIKSGLMLILLSSCTVTQKSTSPNNNDVSDTGTAVDCSDRRYQYRIAGALRQPHVISANHGVLNTKLVVRSQEQCVPIWDDNTGWSLQKKTLRNYGYPINPDLPIEPDNPNDPNMNWTYPGPTLQLRKSMTPTANNGDKLKMTLYNRLSASGGIHDCAPNRQSADHPPNCFHGPNITNFHFHGSHISPQYHQDYVLLSLYPPGMPHVDPAEVRNDPSQAIGKYEYDVDPLPYTQPDGTHWYHAHKHGSTALQLLNGMSGPLIIQGPFDTWLNSYYKNKLRQQILVVQQIEDDLPMTGNPDSPRPQYPLINGQASPSIIMAPGEIQRWRFIGATMQTSAQIEVEFRGKDLQAKQIAMDGVQFSRVNYKKQPLLQPDPETGEVQFNLNPGNRTDLLVKAPLKPGRYYVTHDIFGNISTKLQQKFEQRRKAILEKAEDTLDNPPLLTIEVKGDMRRMKFPKSKRWPKLPAYLTDLPPANITKQMTYDMTGTAPPGTGPTPVFAIDNKMFDGSCVPRKMTTTLGDSEKWIVTNIQNGKPADSTGIQHPFHIHTNPFRLVRYGNTVYNPPIWQDTIALPIGGDEQSSSVEMLMHFAEFTGTYVQHCHILGHEDRGMMSLVQTVCPDTDDKLIGKPRAFKKECRKGNFIPATEICP